MFVYRPPQLQELVAHELVELQYQRAGQPLTRISSCTYHRRCDGVALHGAQNIWLVDPELDLVKVFRRMEGGAFPRVSELTRESGDVLTTPLTAGFALALEELFGD